MSLTPKQLRFTQEYAIDCDATQVAIRAGYSKSSADSIGHENLNKPEIAAAIAERATALSERAGIDAEWVLHELQATYYAARSIGQLGSAHVSLVSIGKHLGMWPNKLTIDRGEAEAISAVLGIDVDEVIAEAECMPKGDGGTRW